METLDDLGAATVVPDTTMTPLLLKTVWESSMNIANLPDDHIVLEEIVTPHPSEPSASITTLIAEIRTPSSARTVVSVYSGPDGGFNRQLHASFTVQANTTAYPPRKRLCWTSFAHTHALLCVLVNATTVAIYDVYPNNKSTERSDNNWTLTLPFECDAIEALPPLQGAKRSGGGLLLQRKADAGDSLEDDSQFVLKSPPKIWSSQHRQYVQQLGEESLQQVPSLFSMHHPLEDVLPVALDAPSSGGSVFESQHVTDPYEKLLWMGTSHWSREGTRHSQVLAVTYHTLWKRHAVWAVKDAPPPPASQPLHQQTAKLMMANSNQHALHDTYLFPHTIDLVKYTEMPSSSSALNHPPTRQEALADALGVKRTPRTSIEPASGGASHMGRSRPQRSAAHSDIFSPRSSEQVMDQSHASWATNQPQQPSTIHISSNLHDPIGPSAVIHSRVAFECLYMEMSNTSREAKQVFLVANESATGNLMLCLLRPKMNNRSSLLLVQMELSPTTNHLLRVIRHEKDKLLHLECLGAQPMSVAPTPCGVAIERGAMATDLLVLTTDHRLQLYRASQHVVECAVQTVESEEDLSLPVDLADGNMSNRVSLTCRPLRTSDSLLRRMRLQLQGGSVLAEKFLVTLDSAFAYESRTSNCPVVALKIRADVRRLEQRLMDVTSQNIHVLLADFGWISCAAVIFSLAYADLFGQNILLKLRLKQDNRPQSAWDHLKTVKGGSEFTASLSIAVRELEAIGSLAKSYLNRHGWNIGLTAIFFDSLHFLYEECKLCSSSFSFLPKISSIILNLCRLFDPHDTQIQKIFAYYGDECELGSYDVISSNEGGMFLSSDCVTSFKTPTSLFSWVERMLIGKPHIHSVAEFRGDDINPSCFKTKSVFRILSSLADLQRREHCGPSIITALLEEGFLSPKLVLEQLPPGFALLCLEMLYQHRSDPNIDQFSEWLPSAWLLVGRDDIAKNIAMQDSDNCLPKLLEFQHEREKNCLADNDGDGLVPIEHSSSMIFNDNRIHEAARLLRSSRPIFLRVPRTVELSDHDYERMKQKKLMLLARRYLALPVGRGMLSIESLKPMAAEPLTIPRLCLKGRVPPANSSLALDDSECPSDMRVWPDFHNGVAAGLRLTGCKESDVVIARTWILYNQPAAVDQLQEGEEAGQEAQRKSHSHGGFLLALGLRGHLTALEMSDVYDYLMRGQVTTTVGMLLGLAANRRGSCDLAVSKMLCLHIPSLIPNHFSAIDVASTVQTAAITGTGLLYIKSSNRMITEFLLNEIGRRPESDSAVFDREAYTLACGIALGMVNLRIGNKNDSDGRAQGLADLHLDDRLNTYIKGGVDKEERQRNRETWDRFSMPSLTSSGDGEHCSTVFEGDQVNNDLTAPAATLALALMYMKTGNQTIAFMLDLPDTQFLLEFIRPDFLSLRVIARTLILWNDVEPSSWVAKQIPKAIAEAYGDIRRRAKQAIGGNMAVDVQGKIKADYDRRAVRQMYILIVAGACFGLGLRFAGTGDERAKASIIKRVLELQKLRDSNDLLSAASRPEYSILETCLGCTAISLAMVLAGTGDLDALRLFKILRWRCEEDSTYGYHMIYGMSIGLLFLGGGSCTLGREPEDIAALIASFYPRFPVSSSDNQYHLQASRHLYALAVKSRLVRAIDADTNEMVRLPIEIRFSGAASVHSLVPCLLRNSDFPVKEFTLLSDKYYPLTVSLVGRSSPLTFFVKKKIFASANLTKVQAHSYESAIAPMSPYQRLFAKYFDAENYAFLSHIVEECQSSGNDEAIMLYLSTSLRSSWDLKLFRTFYERLPTTGCGCIMSMELMLPYLLERTERAVVNSYDSGAIRKYVATMYSNY
ncbi:hypothetical protein MPSEU_000483900 [Mayamaea pseudoterrestris]|nr:hypothetical protein MPSEU_000483900 [Mayamaea pseudoterrestris]